MTDPLPLTPRAIDDLLTNTDPWLSCDDCFEGHDAVIEALLASDTRPDEPFRVHFNACTACLEEARSLAALVAADHGLSADEALRRLDDALTDPVT
jgi:hypothetical protein